MKQTLLTIAGVRVSSFTYAHSIGRDIDLEDGHITHTGAVGVRTKADSVYVIGDSSWSGK